MRRMDLAITEDTAIDEIITRCDCCRLAFADGTRPYIVPLNFGFQWEDGNRVFYFHGAAEGRKVDLIRGLGYAGFELDCDHKLNPADKACNYSMGYYSVVGEGAISQLTDPKEKTQGLQVIMTQITGRNDWDFPEAVLEKTAVFRLVVKELSARGHK